MTSSLQKNKFSFEKVNKALEIAGIAMWEYNCQTHECTFNSIWYTNMGYEPFELPMTLQTFFSLVHPEDLPRLEESVSNFHLKNEDILEIQYRMKTKSDGWVWLRNRSSIERDAQGQPLTWIGSVVDISQLKASENQAINNNQHLNAVVNSLSDTIFEIGSSYRFINCWVPDADKNAKFIKSFQGKLISEVFSGEKLRLYESLINKTFKSKSTQSFTYHSDHTDKFYLARATPLYKELEDCTHVTIVIQEVTEINRAQRELRTKEANLNAIIQNTSDVFWAIDKSENLIVFNKSFDKLIFDLSGKRPQIGNRLDEGFILEETAKRWREIHERSLQGLDTEFSKTLYFKNDRKRLYEFHINPYRNQENEIIGSVVTGRDIDDIYTAKKQAEKAARLKSKFVSTISHEIRTPLNAILGTCYQLAKANRQENLVDDIEILQLASDNLLSLINDVLDFTKLSSGKNLVKPAHVNFPTFIKSLSQFQNRLARNKNLAFTSNQIGDIPDFILTDKTKLHQILTNVISNSIKYTNTGGINFTVRSTKLSDNQSKIQFEIKDTGIGIPKKEIDSIFDSFTQSSNSYNMLKGGTGLGLAITKNLVELLGGKIEVNSNLDQGSTFLFEFTFETTQQDKAVQPLLPKTDKSNSLKILVAEDNEINAKIISRLLSQWNIKYDLAVNGVYAVEFAKRERYHLILMDIQMPEMNGFEAAYQIKQSAQKFNKDTPIVALTAQPDYAFDQNYKEGIFTSSILKPFHPESLKNSIFEQITEAS